MSYSPTAPPPSYDELTPNNSEEFTNIPLQNGISRSSENSNESTTTTNSEMRWDVQLQTKPYAYGQMCLTSSGVPAEPTDTSEVIQPQTILVQPKLIQGSGLIANPDGSYDFGPYPCRVLCPECEKTTQTRIKYKNSGFTHILAGLLCLLGCCCLAPVPYCINSCKNSVHHCGECGKYLGTFVNGYSVNRYHKYNKYRPQYINKICCNDRCCPRCQVNRY